MKRGKRNAQMKTEKSKTSTGYYNHQICSDDEISEIKSQLQIFNRYQLENLICMLSQEIVSLEHKLQSYSLCNIKTDGQNGHSDFQAIIHGEKDSRDSRTKCTVLQRLIQFVKSTSQLKTKKSGKIVQQRNEKVEQLSKTEGSNNDLNLINEIVGDDYENNYEHIDVPLPSHQKNVKFSPSVRTYQNPGRAQTVSNAFLEDTFVSNGTEINKKKEINNNTEILPQEKQLNSTCEERKRPRKNEKNMAVSLEHQYQTLTVGDSMDSFKVSNSGKHVDSEQGSVQDRLDVIHHRYINRSVPEEKLQPSGKSKKNKITKRPSAHNVPKIPSEVSSVKYELKETIETSPENSMFICYFCKVPFRSKLILTEHMKTDHNCTPYSCIVCGKSFRYTHSLKAHQRGNHTGTTVLCSYCGKLVLQTRLDMHIEKVHERPNYTCHICQKGFLKRECLEGHVNKHSNTKPYICEHCGRKYAYSTSLSSHRRQCVRASMPSHLQQPRSLDKSTSCVCEICGLKFEGVSGLKDHLSAKHSNKIQSCNFCGKGFQWRPSYNRHIKKCVDRTDLERERCRWLKNPKTANKHICVCGKQYPYRQSFRRHERSCRQKQEGESSVTVSVDAAANGEVPFSENLSSSLQLPTS